MNHRRDHEVLRLAYAFLEGQASATQLARLESLLIEDGEAREIYIEFMELAAGLCWQRSANRQEVLLEENLSRQAWTQAIEAGDLATPSGLGAVAFKAPSFWQTWNRRVLYSIAGCAAIFVVYFAAISWDMLRFRHREHVAISGGHAEDQKSEIRNQKSEAAPVATIRDSVDAQWSHFANKLEIRNQKLEVAAGEPLAIESGLVELQLKQGVTLLIEGPADWSIDGDNHATLKRGKLVAKVPQQAIGFTVETPTAKIVDLGTEFGVQVDQDGDSTVTVVQGKVDAKGHGNRSMILKAGDAVLMERAKPPIRFAADASTFAEMKSRLKRSGKVLLFSDNFDVHTHRMTINPDVSQDFPSRYGGEVGRLSYVEKPAVTDGTEWASQLNHPVIPMALSVSASAGHMRTSVSPDVDFRAEHPAGVRFWLECDMKPLAAEENGLAIDSWGALIFASENIAADYWDPHVMALLVRPDGKYTIADSTDGTPQDIARGDLVRDQQLPATGWRKVRICYTVARFDGTKPSNVEIEIDGKLIAKFTSKRSPRANHVAMQAFAARGVASCGFDNLKVWSEPMGGER